MHNGAHLAGEDDRAVDAEKRQQFLDLLLRDELCALGNVPLGRIERLATEPTPSGSAGIEPTGYERQTAASKRRRTEMTNRAMISVTLF